MSSDVRQDPQSRAAWSSVAGYTMLGPRISRCRRRIVVEGSQSAKQMPDIGVTPLRYNAVRPERADRCRRPSSVRLRQWLRSRLRRDDVINLRDDDFAPRKVGVASVMFLLLL